MFGFRHPPVVLLAGILAGTLAGAYVSLSPLWLLTSLVVSALLVILSHYYRQGRWFIVALVLLAAATAWFRAGQLYGVSPGSDVGQYADDERPLRFFGEVVTWPVLREHRTLLVCRVDSLVSGDSIRPATGRILVDIRRETTQFVLGDDVSFEGRLFQPHCSVYPGGFDYARYLEHKGIRGVVYVGNPAMILLPDRPDNAVARTVATVRTWIRDCLYARLSQFPAALAAGFLIGETRNIPGDVYLAFRRSGTMHLLAVSGSNVALVLLVFAYMLRFIPGHRVARYVILLVIIVLFTQLSYNQPSVVRASVMAALFLTGRMLYRRADLNNIIAAAAVVLILYDPGNLFDIGFQLSFAVTWGLIFFLPHVNGLVRYKRMPSWVQYGFLIVACSLIASLISAPITAYYFGEISLVTIASNLVVVPLVSLAVVLIVILLVVEIIFPMLAVIPAMALDSLLNATGWLVSVFGQWRLAAMTVPSFPAAYVYMCLIGVTILFLACSYRRARRLGVFYVLICFNVVLAAGLMAAGDDAIAVTAYNTGAGRAVIVDADAGLVAYRGSDRRAGDDFLSGVWTYLKRRGKPLPRYFLFFESIPEIFRRLDEAEAQGRRLDLKPLVDIESRPCPSLWMLPAAGARGTGGHQPAVYLAPGTAIVQVSDSLRLLFTADLSSPPALTDAADIHIHFCESRRAASDLSAICVPERTWLLIAKPPTGDNGIIDKELAGGEACPSENLIFPGESQKIGL